MNWDRHKTRIFICSIFYRLDSQQAIGECKCCQFCARMRGTHLILGTVVGSVSTRVLTFSLQGADEMLLTCVLTTTAPSHKAPILLFDKLKSFLIYCESQWGPSHAVFTALIGNPAAMCNTIKEKLLAIFKYILSATSVVF